MTNSTPTLYKFKHSGTYGDLIYSLPIVKYLGGGEFYLHLDQINWIGHHYYHSPPSAVHQGRLTQEDFECLAPLLAAQDYITAVDVMTSNTEITHNLDRFRPAFVGHPGNYVDMYAAEFGLTDQQEQLRTTPWLTVPHKSTIDGRTVAIHRTDRWLPGQLSSQWAEWRDQGAEELAFFLGLPHEYELFKSATGWDIPYQQTSNLLEMAQYIAGADQFIGNQSVGLSLAIGLGVEYCCEARTDLPLDRNECYFPNQPGGTYF
jgi:hypothetical protein